MIKLKQYLGNTNTLEVHNTSNEDARCRLDDIATRHRRWYDTLAQAKADHAYDNCAWCIGGSTR